MDEHAAESEEWDNTQPRGKSVNAVYQIDGVQDIDDDEYCERHSYVIRYDINTEQPV